MKLASTLKSRFASRSDSEHEQAILRLIIVGLILSYMGFVQSPSGGWTEHERVLVAGLSVFFTIAVAIFACIYIWPARNVFRRSAGMLSDTGGATFYMCLAGEYGVSMIAVYLFVTFGNGFRFGRRYLFASQALSLVGLIGVLILVPYWHAHRPAGIGLLIALVVLPLYVSTLLKRIHEARAKAEEANQAKTAFLANMSHEMRTPLNGVVGLVDLMNATTLSKQQKELMQLLRHSVSVLRSLVDDVLDISKIEAGRLTIELTSFDLHSMVNGLVQLLRPHAQSKGLAFQILVDPEVDYHVQGDPHHIRQVLLNLLGNAIKFTDRGEVALTISLAKETADGMTVRFTVRDTGIGIHKDALDKIFERFVQADQSTTRKFGGTGLGTTIAKQLVELMGGNIGVESEVGHGSTFWFELPLLRDPATQGINDTFESQVGDNNIAVIVAEASRASSLCALVEAVGRRYVNLPTNAQFGLRFEELLSRGAQIDSVVVSANVEVAAAVFAAASQRIVEGPVALLFIAEQPLSVVDKARIQSIRDARVIERSVSPRILRNAIHAALARTETDLARLDLDTVLARERNAARVLVAEDNKTNQAIISQLLNKAGHQVILASDGEEALDLYETEKPDIALLDFNMPLRTGCEVIQTIRLMERPGNRIPAIILSASVTTESRERAQRAGADDFVGKPFDAATLLLKIDNYAARLPADRPVVTPRHKAAVKEQPRARDKTRALRNNEFKFKYLNPERIAEIEDIARDAAFVAELFRGFRIDGERLLEALRDEIDEAESDFVKVKDIAHALRGAAVGVGADTLLRVVDELEESDSIPAKKQLRQIFDRLTQGFNDALSEIDNYMKAQHHANL